MKVRENSPLAEARRNIPFRIAGIVLVTTLAVTLLYAGSAWAKNFTVTNTNDSGAGSLRAAMNKANSLAGADRIVFADGVSGTVTLLTQLPTVTDPAGLAIVGNGDVMVSGNRSVRVFEVDAGAKLAIRTLTIAEGRASRAETDKAYGGGTYNRGTLTVTRSKFSENGTKFGPMGGGIYNSGSATVTDSAFSHNRSGHAGAGIYNGGRGTLTVTHSTFSANEVNGYAGGGIFSRGKLTVTGSTFSRNYAPLIGGGISNLGTLKITDSTFENANGSEFGGAIYTGGEAEITSSTFSGNQGNFGNAIDNSGGTVEATNITIVGTRGYGPPIYNESGTITLTNSVLFTRLSGENCGGQAPVTDGGYNIDSSTSCAFKKATGSLPNTNPLLDPDSLQRNGGPTKTIALRSASLAVDLVGPKACPPPGTDQRGVERPQGASCDAGAYELVK